MTLIVCITGEVLLRSVVITLNDLFGQFRGQAVVAGGLEQILVGLADSPERMKIWRHFNPPCNCSGPGAVSGPPFIPTSFHPYTL